MASKFSCSIPHSDSDLVPQCSAAAAIGRIPFKPPFLALLFPDSGPIFSDGKRMGHGEETLNGTRELGEDALEAIGEKYIGKAKRSGRYFLR